MNWFKHVVDGRRDSKLKAVLSEKGLAGLGAWWVLVESVAEQSKAGTVTPSTEMTWAQWGAELHSSSQGAYTYLRLFESLGLCSLSETRVGKRVTVRVEIPKLLKYGSRYFKDSAQGSTPNSTPNSTPTAQASSLPEKSRTEESNPEPLAQGYDSSPTSVQRASSERPDGPAFRAPAPQPRRRQVLAREKDQWSPPAPEGGALEARVLDAQQQRRQEAQSRLRDEYLMACVQARRRGETPPDEASWREHRLSGESVEVASVNAEPMAGLENLKANARAKGLDVDGARLTREREERESARKRTGASQATAKAVQPKQEEEFDDPFAD